MKGLSALLLAALAAPAFGQYAYYFTDPMQSLQTSDWTSSGSPAFTNSYGYWGGYGSAGPAAMVSKVAVPDGTASYEVRATVHFPSGIGISTPASILLRSNSTFSANGIPTNAYLVQFICASSNSVVTISKIVNGTITQLTSSGITCSDGMTIRAAISDNGQIIPYVNDALVGWTQDTSITSGAPGIVLSSYLGSDVALVTQVQLGPADRIAPGPIPTNGLTYSVYSNHIDFQWLAVPDDPNGTGVVLYQFLRNDQWAQNTTSLSWSDTTVQPGVEYSYTFMVLDYFFNPTSETVTITVPPLPGAPPTPPDGRRVGVRSTGAYWGASTEQIDVLSGNVNYTVPLLKAQGRTGWSVGFSLAYNSQNWRHDSGGIWNLGEDVGYGYGRKLLAGSLTPIWADQYTLYYYSFVDSTGAEYRLNQNNGGIWTSSESIYVTFNSSTHTLYFRDGSFWVLGCTSATSEADSGTMYPTTLEDTNGNQVIVTYQPGAGLGGTNSSARISQIQDVRGSYLFTYNSDTPHHLTSITNGMQTPETYTFQYGTLSLQAPFSPYTSYGTVAVLSTIEMTANSQIYSFTYTSDNSGALQSSTLPNGGVLTWSYQNVTYGNGGTYREILQRQLSKDGVNYTNYPFTFPSPGYNTNLSAVIDDPGGVGEKFWAFSQTGVNAGMVTQYQGRQLPGPVTKTQNDFTWTQDNIGNLYIGSTLTTLDPGQSYQAQKRTDQTVDVYGNVLNVFQYDYNSLATPSRVYTYTYLNTSAYTSRYIYNRLTQATLGIGNQNVITLASNAYDATFSAAPTGVTNWDTAYASVTARGDVTSYTSGSDSGSTAYDSTGNATSATLNGVATQVTTTSATNYAAPSQLSVGGLTTSMDWTSALGFSSATGPNGDSSSMTYANGIPATSTSTFGAQTTYVYPTGPNGPSNLPIPKATTNGRWMKTTLDGLGRTISIQTGNASGAISQTDTVYGSCGCSPTGKMIQQSLPHAPTAGAVWTTYTYDGIGRTLSVLAPDGASTSAYLYLGNTVKVTDPAGKWKTFTMDAFGHLTQVDEPNPGSGSTPPQPVSPPSFSPAPGGYTTSQTVTLTTSTSGASIRYTTNGTMPSETVGTLYSGTIAVSSSTTINAIAYAGGMADSAISAATYTIGSGGSGTAWYNSAWTYRKPITIAHGEISGSSILTNFPVLISETDSNLAASAQSNGYDILFTASDGLTKLSHEIETYTSSTGLLNAWVGVPSLSPTTDTVIYMYFGNPSAPNQQHSTGAWDSNYVGVWHLPNGSTLSPNDSTVNANNGTISGAGAVAGEIGGAGSFNGTSSNISVGNSSTEQINGTVTMSAWVNVAAFQPVNTANWAYVIGKGYDGTREGYYLRLNALNSSVIQLNAGSFSGSTNFCVLWPITGWTTNTWHHIVGTYDGTNWNVYFDGALKASSTQAIGAVPSGLGTYLGVQNINGTLQRFWNGDLDEVRLSNTARSAGWIATEYNNQANPSTFYAYGALQTQNMTSGGYQFSRQITLNAATYNPGAQSNFTVLICANSSSGACNASVTGLNQSGSGSHVQNSNGYDIAFSSTSCTSPTLMKWEMENYVASTGEMEAWVLIPSLGTTNQTIYVCYGNAAVSTFQGGGSASTWNGNYKFVSHFSHGSTLSVADSTGLTSPTNDGATAATGYMGGGAGLNGSSQFIDVPMTITYPQITASIWWNLGGGDANGSDRILSNSHTDSDGNGFQLVGGYGNPGTGFFDVGANTVSTANYSIGAFNQNTWHYFVGTYDGTYARYYVDGVLRGTSSAISGSIKASGYDVNIGRDPGFSGVGFIGGVVDEARISNTALSQNWITTEYNNQSSPNSFSTMAAEQTVGGGGGYLAPVGMPTFSPAPGTYTSSQTVTLTTSTTGASIRYTTNGTTPSETAGALYAGPITVPNTSTIKAIAYESGMADSEISTATYTISGSSGSGDYLTYYTYDGWDNVSQVFMPRSSGTQIRTFTYNARLLLSATNPENGTVTYTYNSYNKVAKKTDAKGQAVVYTYDSIARLTKVQRYPTGTSGSEDTCQQENYYYDSNSFTPSYSLNALGRLAAIQYYAPASGLAGYGCATTFVEQYSYNQAGAKINKGVLVARSLQSPTGFSPYTVDLESSYTYDTEGRMLTVQYPGSTGSSAGPNLGYAYDTMGRLNTMTDLATSASLISATTYDPANRLSSITGSVYNESRSYNVMGQLTGLTSNSVSMVYNYSATQNNGKITGQTDNVSGEQVVYAYDALNRLASAASTTSSWGQSYSYDGFGNLTDQTVTAGSAPSLHVVYNASNNRQTTDCGDANGNINSAAVCSGAPYGYDVENRIVWVPGNTAYAYAPGNERVWRGTTSANHLTLDELTFWSVTGQKLATYTIQGGDPTVVYSPPTMGVVLATSNYYFGRKLIKNGNGYVGSDRLGSVGKFYPYGQEKPSATTNGTEKFTGYFRDSETTLDYAINRYHQPGMGRFLTPDPAMDNVDYTNPGSWNAYAYVNGDPVNFNDPDGLATCGQTMITGGTFGGQTVSQVMTGTSGDDLLAQIIWHEGGTITSSDLSNPTAYGQDLAAIGTAVLNQWDVDDGRLSVYQNGQAVCPLGHCLDRSLQQIIIAIATYRNAAGNVVPVFDSSGHMIDGAAAKLAAILSTNFSASPVVNDNGNLTNQGCEGVLSSLFAAGTLLDGAQQRVSPNGLTLLFWNQAPASSTTTFPGNAGYTGWRDSRAQGETFWGLSSAPPPVRKPRRRKP